MKNLLFLLFIALSGLMIMSCEGPAGPVGPAGSDGVDGTDGIDGVDGVDGTDGADGVDGNMICVQCHSLTHRGTIEAQYEMTRHYNNTAVGYAGGRKSCARCHSHEGFTETRFTGMDTTAANIAIPTAIGCKTCHSSHKSFDFQNDGQDFAIRTNDPIDLIISDEFVDFGDNSNLCGTCHQPRRPAPVADANGNFNITSTHYGPHHAPNTALVYGIGGYETAGAESYPAAGTAGHFTGASCIKCHMYRDEANVGGHDLIPNEAACLKCHAAVPNIEAEIEGYMTELAGLLMAEGVLDADGHVVKGEFPVDVAGAFFNYALIEEDLSHGVHNPKYARALLKNSIDALK